MALEKTLAIIKPDSLEKGVIGEICQRMENANLKIVGIKMLNLDTVRAQGFYAVHKDKPFFEALIKFMTSGPCIALVLEGKDAITNWRKTMGATDPEQAEEGSIRCDFGTNVERNAVHGSDSPENAEKEIAYFFEPSEIVNYDWM